MPRKPGAPKTGGRKKGVPNKVNAELKEMVMQAFNEAGGVKYLKAQATANPVAFMSMLGKLLPRQIEADIEVDGELTIRWQK